MPSPPTTLPTHPASTPTTTAPQASRHPFRSRRLLFTALDPANAADCDFFFKVQASDIDAQANSNYALLRPFVRKDLDERLKVHAEGELLCVGFELADATDAEGGRTRVGMLTLSGGPVKHAHHRSSEIGVDVLREFQGKGGFLFSFPLSLVLYYFLSPVIVHSQG